MDLVLTTEQQRRFMEAARALVSPLEYPSVEAWRDDALVKVARLVEADCAGFLLPVPGHTPFGLHGLPERFGTEFIGDEEQRAMTRAWVRDGVPKVWSTRLLGARAGLRMPDDWFAMPEFRNFYARYGLEEAVGFMTTLEAVQPTAVGSLVGRRTGTPSGPVGLPAMLTCFRREYGSEAFGDQGLMLMQMLQPAAEAGVMTVARQTGAVATVAQLLEQTRAGAQVVHAEGTILHRNSTLMNLLSEDTEAGAIEEAMVRVATSLDPIHRSAAEAARPGRLSGANTTVRTHTGEYRVWATLLPGYPTLGHEATLVQVEPSDPALPTHREIRERWGLTRQQARVARLLAWGRSNREVADALGIRPSTARGYTEVVFHRLGVKARGEVALRLRDKG